MKLFISYARLDYGRVSELVSLFRKIEHSIWFDYALLPGQVWQKELSNQIKDCDVFVVAISERSLISEWCKWELNLAFSENKNIFPVILDADISIPDTLNTLHIANFTKSTTTHELNRIMGGLAHINSELSSTFKPDISHQPKGRPSRDKWLEQHKQNSAHMHLDYTSARTKRNKIPDISNDESSVDHSFSGIIGIDFGTSTSLCAVFIDEQPIIIPNRFGNTYTPSAVYINEDGSFSIGESAIKAALLDPKHAVLQVKRLFGSDAVFRAYGKKYTAPQLAAEIIKVLVKDCNAYLNASCFKAVITAPAYFTETQLDDLRIACQLAGVIIVRIIVESSAACLAYGCNTMNDDIVAVFDIGGGTFDISIVELAMVEDEIQCEVLSTSGQDKLGGSDYDQTIVNYCITCFKDQTGIDLSNNLVAQMRLRDAAEFAKIELTCSTKTVIHIPMIYADASGSYDLTMPLSEKDYDNLTEHLTSKIMDCCEEALKACGEQVKNLILIGQASRTPFIRKQAEKFFKCKANIKVEANKAVAIGAAWQGSVLSGNNPNLLLIDVVSHDLGIVLKGEVIRIIVTVQPPM